MSFFSDKLTKNGYKKAAPGYWSGSFFVVNPIAIKLLSSIA